MKKKQLAEAAGISSASIAKLGRSENVILLKICIALNSDISDIMEVVSDEEIQY